MNSMPSHNRDYFVEAARSCAQLTAELRCYARRMIKDHGEEMTKDVSTEVSAMDIKNWLNACYRLGVCLENLEALVMDLIPKKRK